ncbi:putative enoyl-CoA hydratase echA17 [Mycobacterium botniense]|uniref:Putative enoyl-CoA hydratase echA17 n=1 Tax=Mycobacterium botniense TaxID=84962 RepID=A0A7I9Y3L0_9MYCO|nr:putative enoyl-CoA hydratase echA17 [Mycobacterium botniense]
MREFVSVHLGADHPGVATLMFSRPPTNALTRQVYREIAGGARELGCRDDVAAVILFGGQDIFSAGDEIPTLRALTAAQAQTWARVRHGAVAAVAAIPKPTVAAITGYALGVGLTLALAADWRVSGDNVKFGVTEISAGLIPDGDLIARLTRVVGVSRAKDLVYSGRFVGAEEALSLRLVDELAAPDHVYDAAAAWAGRFVGSPAQALAAAKASIDDVFETSTSERLAAGRRRYLEVFTAAGSADRPVPGPPPCGSHHHTTAQGAVAQPGHPSHRSSGDDRVCDC